MQMAATRAIGSLTFLHARVDAQGGHEDAEDQVESDVELAETAGLVLGVRVKDEAADGDGNRQGVQAEGADEETCVHVH